MATSKDDVVLVTTLRGSNNIAGIPRLSRRIDVESSGESSPSRDLIENRLRRVARDRRNGDVRANFGALGGTQSTPIHGSGLVVVDDGSGCLGGSSQRDLETELAGSSGDERDLAFDLGGVVSLGTRTSKRLAQFEEEMTRRWRTYGIAAKVGDRDDLGGYVSRGAVGEPLGLDGAIFDGEGGFAGGEEVREGL